MSWKARFSGIAINVMFFGIFFVSVGTSQPAGESFISNDPVALTKPKILKKTKPQSLGVSKVTIMPVSNPETMKVSEPKLLQPTVTKEGVPVFKSIMKKDAYIKCAKFKQFDDLLKCARQGIHGSSEEDE